MGSGPGSEPNAPVPGPQALVLAPAGLNHKLSTTTAHRAETERGDVYSGCGGRRLGVSAASGTSAADAGAARGRGAGSPASAALPGRSTGSGCRPLPPFE